VDRIVLNVIYDMDGAAFASTLPMIIMMMIADVHLENTVSTTNA
jgi:hypothetical protein